jgi:toxin ParE1/3/4
MRLEIVEAALDEAERARDHYAAIRPELGAAFAAELERALQRAAEHPLAWASLDGHTRRCRLDRFPYRVVYRVEPDLVRVLAVMHERQRPGYWRRR